LARVAIAALFDRTEIRFVSSGFDTDAAFAGERSAISCDACRKNAIEHVHSARNQLHELRRSPEAHGIARLVFWQERFCHLDCLEHFWLRLTHTDSPYGVAVKLQLNQSTRAFLSFGCVCAALCDSKNQLAWSTR